MSEQHLYRYVHSAEFYDGFPMRYTFRHEMEHLLVRSGFVVEALYGGFDRSPFGTKYPGELIFVARKARHSH